MSATEPRIGDVRRDATLGIDVQCIGFDAHGHVRVVNAGTRQVRHETYPAELWGLMEAIGA